MEWRWRETSLNNYHWKHTPSICIHFWEPLRVLLGSSCRFQFGWGTSSLSKPGTVVWRLASQKLEESGGNPQLLQFSFWPKVDSTTFQSQFEFKSLFNNQIIFNMNSQQTLHLNHQCQLIPLLPAIWRLVSANLWSAAKTSGRASSLEPGDPELK